MTERGLPRAAALGLAGKSRAGGRVRREMVDRAMLTQHLARAEELVHVGAEYVAGQQRLVADLEGHGHDGRLARELLTTFEQSQAMHVVDRDRLAAELAEASEM